MKKYYTLHRPVSIGTYPKEGMVEFHNYDYRQENEYGIEAWGWLLYDRELTSDEIEDYELMSEDECIDIQAIRELDRLEAEQPLFDDFTMVVM